MFPLTKAELVIRLRSMREATEERLCDNDWSPEPILNFILLIEASGLIEFLRETKNGIVLTDS